MGKFLYDMGIRKSITVTQKSSKNEEESIICCGTTNINKLEMSATYVTESFT